MLRRPFWAYHQKSNAELWSIVAPSQRASESVDSGMRGGDGSTAIELATHTRSGAWVSRASMKAQTGMKLRRR